jgi:ATP-dependent RNA helicase DeaD
VRRAQALFAAAGVTAQWTDAPTPELVRARDGARLLEDPALTEELSPEDQALASTLLEGRSAEDIAGALVRLYRARLPSPEELADPAALPDRRKSPRAAAHDPHPGREDTRPPRARSGAGGPTRWFSLNIGRDQKADPKWLIPVICRLGGVTKREIGAIRILPTETRFEVAEAYADNFAELPGDVDPRITPSGAPPPAAKPRAHHKAR